MNARDSLKVSPTWAAAITASLVAAASIGLIPANPCPLGARLFQSPGTRGSDKDWRGCRVFHQNNAV
jgi:hypothetical protein